MSRVQLALSVGDVDAAVSFYSKVFDTAPAKVRPGYANFAIADPPLKLVLIEDQLREPGSLNHLGVEVDTVTEVRAAAGRLAATGIATWAEDGVCCYAVQDKIWVGAPDGEPWEIYTVLADADMVGHSTEDLLPSDAGCCSTRSDLSGNVVPACC